MKKLIGILNLIFILSFLISCEKPATESNGDEPGVFESPNYLHATLYLKDYDSNAPISNATIEWQKELSGPGSIVEVTSATCSSDGKFQLEKSVNNSVSSFNRVITRIYAPGYSGWAGTQTITMTTGAGPTKTAYLKHL